MKIAVYAICKNEWKFLDGWLRRCGEADYVCVLDTGSTDGTWEALEARKEVMPQLIAAQRVFTPWRFDVARNESLTLIPEDADVCFCLDLDELPEEGWAEKLRRAWDGTWNCGRYEYVWNFRSDGKDGVKFLGEKLHKNGCIRWKSPVHEYPVFMEERIERVLPIRVEHHADDSKSRGQYLPLLKLAVEEDPENDRNLHYLGREYLFHGKWGEAILTLRRHLACPNATWAAERCNSMRFIARCWRELGERDKEELWLLKAAREAPNRREPLVDLAWFYYEREQWRDCREAAEEALRIEKPAYDYTTEPEAWGSLPWDLMSIAHWRLGEREEAAAAARRAVELEPEDERLQQNLRLMEQK